jgi:hypothetical protein
MLCAVCMHWGRPPAELRAGVRWAEQANSQSPTANSQDTLLQWPEVLSDCFFFVLPPAHLVQQPGWNRTDMGWIAADSLLRRKGQKRRKNRRACEPNGPLVEVVVSIAPLPLGVVAAETRQRARTRVPD